MSRKYQFEVLEIRANETATKLVGVIRGENGAWQNVELSLPGNFWTSPGTVIELSLNPVAG